MIHIESLQIDKLEELEKALTVLAKQHGLHGTVKIRNYRDESFDPNSSSFRCMSYSPDTKEIIMWYEGLILAQLMARDSVCRWLAADESERFIEPDEVKRLFREAILRFVANKLAHEVCHLIDHSRHTKLNNILNWFSNLRKKPSLWQKRWLRGLLTWFYKWSPLELHASYYAKRHQEAYYLILEAVVPN